MPKADHIGLAIETIKNSHSPFEQYHGLSLAYMFLEDATLKEREQLREALLEPRGIPIHDTDASRWDLREELLSRLERIGKESESSRKKKKKK